MQTQVAVIRATSMREGAFPAASWRAASTGGGRSPTNGQLEQGIGAQGVSCIDTFTTMQQFQPHLPRGGEINADN